MTKNRVFEANILKHFLFTHYKLPGVGTGVRHNFGDVCEAGGGGKWQNTLPTQHTGFGAFSPVKSRVLLSEQYPSRGPPPFVLFKD